LLNANHICPLPKTGQNKNKNGGITVIMAANGNTGARMEPKIN